jgi:hypothetical protein
MSLNYNQLIREIEKNCGFDVGGISNNVQRKADFTADINMAVSDTVHEIFDAGGTWQYDDTSHPDYPIIRTDLISGQRDYTFTYDEQGNLILDIYRVVVMGKDGIKREIDPVDIQSRNSNLVNTDSLINGVDAQGQPSRYDKTANGILLDLIPDYDAEGGLEIYINRESIAFLTTDGAKTPGFAGTYHEICALIPSYKYARNKSLGNVARLEKDVNEMKAKIKAYYGKRERDIKRRLIPNKENNR